jgi:hypothetical protein
MVVLVPNGLVDLVLFTLAVVAAVGMVLAQEAQGEPEVGELVVAGRQTITPLAGPTQVAVVAGLVGLELFKPEKVAVLEW